MVTPLTANGRVSFSAQAKRHAIGAALVVALTATAAAAPPKIRTDADNAVPRCVTPKRLMAFIKTRNSNLEPRFSDIANYYKKHGEIWHVRWDYAFFQMAVETNFLTYRKGNGGWGDVDPKQNNFAGLGTTGGGVPGDSYPDVNTGVLAQIQHLVVYSGERIDEPVGARTRLKQDDILATMEAKKGRTTFADLSRRWAADRHYGASIEWVANNFRQTFCKGPDPVEEAAPSKREKRAAAADKDMARAANLGGPQPGEVPDQPSGSPVRTVWSATGGPITAEMRTETPAAPPAAPAKPEERAAPVPTRKPATDERPVVAEQIVQTGEEPAPPATLAAVNAPTAETPPAQAVGEPQRAFAFAAAMSSTRSAGMPLASEPASAAPKVTAIGGGCRVLTASYGGKKALLVRSGEAPEARYTVLTVLEGFEKSMLDNYLKAHAPGGSSVGEFASKDAALAKARELCPSAAGMPNGEGASAG